MYINVATLNQEKISIYMSKNCYNKCKSHCVLREVDCGPKENIAITLHQHNT